MFRFPSCVFILSSNKDQRKKFTFGKKSDCRANINEPEANSTPRGPGKFICSLNLAFLLNREGRLAQRIGGGFQGSHGRIPAGNRGHEAFLAREAHASTGLWGKKFSVFINKSSQKIKCKDDRFIVVL